MVPMFIQRIIYGRAYVHTYKYDCVLDSFANSDSLSNDILYANNPPQDFYSVIDFLSQDGMIKVGRGGITITEKGKAMRRSGGYRGKALKERIIYLGVVIGIVAGVIAIIISLC